MEKDREKTPGEMDLSKWDSRDWASCESDSRHQDFRWKNEGLVRVPWITSCNVKLMTEPVIIGDLEFVVL